MVATQTTKPRRQSDVNCSRRAGSDVDSRDQPLALGQVVLAFQANGLDLTRHHRHLPASCKVVTNFAQPQIGEESRIPFRVDGTIDRRDQLLRLAGIDGKLLKRLGCFDLNPKALGVSLKTDSNNGITSTN